MRFQSFHMKWLNGYLAWMPAGMQTNHSGSLHMHSGFPAKMVEQMFVMSFNDVTMISHA